MFIRCVSLVKNKLDLIFLFICILFFVRIRHPCRFLFPKKLCYPFCPGKIEFDFSILVGEVRFISFVRWKTKSKWSKVVGRSVRFKGPYILSYGIDAVCIQSRFWKARSNYLRTFSRISCFLFWKHI